MEARCELGNILDLSDELLTLIFSHCAQLDLFR